MSRIVGLILCGGRSLRLWPLSEYKSKNFLDIFGFNPLEATIKRFLKITTSENIFLVTNKNEENVFKKLNCVTRENIIFEPDSKNTAAAILLSIFMLKKRYQDCIIVVSPVDHFIKDSKNFYKAINLGIKVAQDGWICTVGIKPLYPSPQFGYIQIDKEISPCIYSIKRFIEKPTRLVAQELIKKHNAFYNSGIFIASLATLEKEYKQYYQFYKDFQKLFESDRLTDQDIVNLYAKLDDIAFDQAIMEKTKKARLIKGDFFWRDFGSWQAIYEMLPKDKDGNVKKGNIFSYASENNFIYECDPKKKVLVVGFKDVFFVDTQDYILITTRAYLDNLKFVLKEFKSKL